MKDMRHIKLIFLLLIFGVVLSSHRPTESKKIENLSTLIFKINYKSFGLRGFGGSLIIKNLETNELFESHTKIGLNPFVIIENLPIGIYKIEELRIITGGPLVNLTDESVFNYIKLDKPRIYYLGNYITKKIPPLFKLNIQVISEEKDSEEEIFKQLKKKSDKWLYLKIEFEQSLFKADSTEFYSTFSHKDSIGSDTILKDEYSNQGMTFTVQGGLWIPIGNLDKTFDINPNISFRWGIPITKELRLDAGASMNIPLKSKSFDYSVDDSTYSVNSNNTVNGVLGLWLNHENTFNKTLFLDKYFGLGVAFIHAEKEKPNPTNKNDSWYEMGTINFNFGLGIRKIAFRRSSIGLFIEYNFTPYSLFDRVDNNFGNSSVITGLSYTF